MLVKCLGFRDCKIGIDVGLHFNFTWTARPDWSMDAAEVLRGCRVLELQTVFHGWRTIGLSGLRAE